MHQYSAAERSKWPTWLALQWQEFVKVIRDLNDYIVASPGQPHCDTAQAYIIALTAPGGIAYHFDRPFPIGGPGAHADDIAELMKGFGDRHRVGRLQYSTRDSPVAKSVERYRAFLADHARLPKGLSLTSGSARVRLRAIELRVSEPIFTDSSDAQIQKYIPQDKVESGRTGDRFSHYLDRHILIQELLAILIRSGISVDVEDAKTVLRQGGSWNSILQRWQSLPEHFETVLSQEYRRGARSRWWSPETSFWHRDHHGNWTTPRGAPESDNTQIDLTDEDLEGVVSMTPEFANDRTIHPLG